MKKYISTGLIILLPIALTIWIIRYLLDLFTAPLFDLVESFILWYESQQGLSLLHHESLVVFLSYVIAFAATFLLILILGFLGRRYFFTALLNMANKIMIKIPFVGAIYRLTKDVTKAMFSSEQKAFKATVLVPFPTPESHALAFITGDVPPALKDLLSDTDLTVFVPTAPHPMSGYILFCAKKEARPVAISSEETFKFLLSCGVAPPKSS